MLPLLGFVLITHTHTHSHTHIHMHTLTHTYTCTHTCCAAVAPGVVSSSVVGSAEYSAAMELEMWKLTEEEAFQEQLKAREKTHMAKLGGEKV